MMRRRAKRVKPLIHDGYNEFCQQRHGHIAEGMELNDLIVASQAQAKAMSPYRKIPSALERSK